jgi:hypothetical protein
MIIKLKFFLQVKVTFVAKNIPNDSGFSVTLSMQTTYAQMRTAVAKHLNRDPTNLQVMQKTN